MIKNWNSFNEEISWPRIAPWKKQDDKSTPLTGPTFSSEVKPDEGPNRSFSQVKHVVLPKNVLTDYRVDSDVLQEISDRLYGPDSEEYVKAILDLNSKFRKREGRYGSQLVDEESRRREEERKKRQQEIINKFK